MWFRTGMSSRATALPYSFPTYTSGNMATTVADVLAPHTLLHDPMMSTLNPIVIAYIEDMVNRQAWQQERELTMSLLSPSHTQLRLNQYHCLRTSECPNSECSTGLKFQPSTWLIIFPGVVQSQMALRRYEMHYCHNLCTVIRRSNLHLVCKPSRSVHYQLASNGTRIPLSVLQYPKTSRGSGAD